MLDPGSGSGTDAFVAALRVGDAGSVTGLDTTDERLEKARRLRDDAGMENVAFERGYVEDLPFDVVVSNGVVTLSAAKDRVFAEVNRVLVPDGRLAMSDIVSEARMPDGIETDADLWAACIGGAEQADDDTDVIGTSGFEVVEVRANPEYEFVSDRAANACQKYGVRSVSLEAHRR